MIFCPPLKVILKVRKVQLQGFFHHYLLTTETFEAPILSLELKSSTLVHQPDLQALLQKTLPKIEKLRALIASHGHTLKHQSQMSTLGDAHLATSSVWETINLLHLNHLATSLLQRTVNLPQFNHPAISPMWGNGNLPQGLVTWQLNNPSLILPSQPDTPGFSTPVPNHLATSLVRRTVYLPHLSGN